MAPRVAAFQINASKHPDHLRGDVFPTADEEVEDDEVQYGYLQIDRYVEFKKKGAEQWAPRWVSLPIGTHVHTYSGTESQESHQMTPKVFPLRLSCMKQARGSVCVDDDCCDSMSTISTAASSCGLRRAHFADDLLQESGEDPVLSESDLACTTTSSLAEWFYIDRDICGFSLHEYNPEVNDFASSPYGCEFLEELAKDERLNRYKRQMISCKETEDQCKHEERQLDKALLSAGVRAWCVHEDEVDHPVSAGILMDHCKSGYRRARYESEVQDDEEEDEEEEEEPEVADELELPFVPEAVVPTTQICEFWI